MLSNISSLSVPGPENEVYLVFFRAVQSIFCDRTGRNGLDDTRRTK